MTARIAAARFSGKWLVLWLMAVWWSPGNYSEARAHANPNAAVPALRALNVEEPMTADGALDEPFWSRCEVATGLMDTRTGQAADQQTLIRVACTRTHVYVAVECLDDHIAELRASERREDRSFTGDDWVEVHFDPPHTHRSKYAFFANPLGTRADANEGPSGVFNYGWSADWELGAKILADRWVFEMKIPLGVMNYERRDGASWGFNITRQLRRTDVLSFWSYSATDMYKPRHFGHLTGLDLADSKFNRNWQITPYASVRTDFDGDTDTFGRAGVDVSVRLTPSITSALAVNPDFGQVEADAATIELRDTERFLPEKRLFFREGDELLRMPYQLYYSRRFTDIDAGLNTSGQWRQWRFSFLNVQGEVRRGGQHFYGNSTVLRVLQDVNERSSLGYYLSASELEEGHSRVLGADGYFLLNDVWRISCQAVAADDRWSDPHQGINKDSRDFLGYAALIYERHPWHFSLSGRAITEQFNPLLGYIPRQDIYGPAFEADYHPRSSSSWYKDLTVGYGNAWYWDREGQTRIRDNDVYARVVFPNDLGVRAAYFYDYHAPYYNPRTSAGVTVFTSDQWKSIEGGWAAGEFEDIDYNELYFRKPVKFWERLPITYELSVRFENRPLWITDVLWRKQERTAWLNRVLFDLFLAKEMWIKTSFQQQDSAVHNLSVIYGWQFQRNRWWYLVYNDVSDGRERGRSIFSKITYTL